MARRISSATSLIRGLSAGPPAQARGSGRVTQIKRGYPGARGLMRGQRQAAASVGERAQKYLTSALSAIPRPQPDKCKGLLDPRTNRRPDLPLYRHPARPFGAPSLARHDAQLGTLRPFRRRGAVALPFALAATPCQLGAGTQ